MGQAHAVERAADLAKGAALLAKHRAAFPSDGEAGAFAEAAKKMLGELQDIHVTVRMGDGRIFPTFIGDAPRNYDYRAVAARLKGMKQVGRIGQHMLSLLRLHEADAATCVDRQPLEL